jgi:tripartite-type tricarboxylate transporter receptor subunit TctC
VRSPDISARLNGMGCIPTTNTPQEFAAFVAAEMEKWGGLAKKVNLQPN